MTKEKTVMQIMHDNKLDKYGLPLGRLFAITRNDGEYFTIKAMDKPIDRIYQGKVLPTFYAVFRYNEYQDLYVQVSKWYWRYGNAVRALGRIAKDI